MAGLYLAAVCLGALVVLFLRRPEGLLSAEFWADDGAFYQVALLHGPVAIIWSYAGYLSVVQGMVAVAEAGASPIYAPVIGNLSILVITALVAAFLASDRLSNVFPDRRWRVAAALLFVALPAGDRLLGTMSNIQWILGVYLTSMLVATPPTTGRGRLGDALGMLIGGLSGAIGIVLLPLFAIRAWRDRGWRWHLFWLTIASAIQIAVYLVSFRYRPASTEWPLVPELLLLRAILVPLTGIYGPVGLPVAILLAVAAFVAVVVAVAQLPRPWLAGAAYICLVIPLSGIRATEYPTADLIDPFLDGRYFYLGGVVLAGLIVLAAISGRWLAMPALALLIAGVVLDFRMPPVPSAGWAAAAGCLKGPVPCIVPVQPGPHWAVSWPDERYGRGVGDATCSRSDC